MLFLAIPLTSAFSPETSPTAKWGVLFSPLTHTSLPRVADRALLVDASSTCGRASLPSRIPNIGFFPLSLVCQLQKRKLGNALSGTLHEGRDPVRIVVHTYPFEVVFLIEIFFCVSFFIPQWLGFEILQATAVTPLSSSGFLFGLR